MCGSSMFEFVRLEPERAAGWCWSPRTARSRNRVAQRPGRLADLGVDRGLELPQRPHIRGMDHCRSEGTSSSAPLKARQAELDELTQKIVATGLASWSGGESGERKLIVRGQAHLPRGPQGARRSGAGAAAVRRSRTRREVIDLLGRAEQAEGVRIFNGFGETSCSRCPGFLDHRGALSRRHRPASSACSA